MRYLISASISLLTFLLAMCSSPSHKIDFQGHRGARGLLPENTLISFQKAMELGVTTLELDLAVSKEGILIVSHEPWFNAAISSHPDGTPVSEEEEHSLKIYEMSVDQIQSFDVGMRGNPRFSMQQAQAAVKPTFRQVVELAESWAKENGVSPFFYNIETKSMPEGDAIFHPEPKEFVEIILAEIEEYGIKDRTIVQSFDIRTLEAMRALDSEVVLALLVEDANELPEALEKMTFIPEIFSPNYETLTSKYFDLAKANKMHIVPWTVNDVSDMRKLLEMGVDGLISDYPDRFLELR